MNPSVSVVMSVYNGEEYLNEAIDSILSQTFKSFEFIIINDGSTDSSSKILRSYADPRIVLIEQENNGLSKALNIGIGRARSDLIARMDADDISMPERIKLQYEFLKKHPECVAVGSNAEVIDKDGRFIHYSNKVLDWPTIRERVLPVISPFFHSSTMFRKKAFLEVGGYPELVILSQDGVFFKKMGQVGELINLKKNLIKYRITPSASSRRSKEENDILFPIKQKYLNDEDLSEEDKKSVEALRILLKKRKVNGKFADYYILIGKKFLFRNYQPLQAIQNFIKSLQYAPFAIQTYALILLSMCPKTIVNILHKKRVEFRGF